MVIYVFSFKAENKKTTETSLAHVRTKNVATPSVRDMGPKDTAEINGIIWSTRYLMFGDLPVIWSSSLLSKLLWFPSP